jgi:hypothetical protein
MANLLTDLCIESEAHTLTAMYLAATYDASLYDYSLVNSFPDTLSGGSLTAPAISDAQELFRIGVAVGKYWITKRYPNFAYECMEVKFSSSFLSPSMTDSPS